MPGRPDPECNSDGTYAPSQCLGVMCMCVDPDSGVPGLRSQHFIWDDQFDCSVQQWEYSLEFDPVEGMEVLGGGIAVSGGDQPDSGSDGSDGDKQMPDGDKEIPDGDERPDESGSSDKDTTSGTESATDPDAENDNSMEGPEPFFGNRGGVYR